MDLSAFSDGLGWLHEIKFDGYRVAALVNGGKATLLTGRGLDWTARFLHIADDLERLLKVRSAYLDEEIVSLTRSGISNFGSLQASCQERTYIEQCTGIWLPVSRHIARASPQVLSQELNEGLQWCGHLSPARIIQKDFGRARPPVFQ